jgi:uncharacterized protein (DUF2252 family)
LSPAQSASTPILSKTKRSVREEARLRQGRQQRSAVGRAQLGEVDARKRRFHPLDVLLHATEGRLTRLLPLKYGRMSASPFAFFRGAVSIMAADLARDPHTGIFAQLCGDAHLQNLGCYGAPDGRLVFDLNDFDETIAGPWEWDLKRMAASIVLAGLEAGHRHSECASAVQALLNGYTNTITELAEQPVLVAARHQIHRTEKIQAVSLALQQAERANPLDLLAKYTAPVSRNSFRFKKLEHVLWPVSGKEKDQVLRSLGAYRRSLTPAQLHLFEFFQPVDVAFKVVGTGSVGLRDYVILMEGNGPADPLFLQIKQEVRSAYAPYLKSRRNDHEGRRVAEAQRKIQPLSDLLLGWTRIGKQDYLVRQLNDHKGRIDLERLHGDGLSSLSALAGELLARGHARSGDALVIKGYIGNTDKVCKPLVHYGLEYAKITEADFELFESAIKNGRIKIEE